MRLPFLRTLSALGVATILGAGAPTAVTHAANVTATSTLTVELYCPITGLRCEAYASGGSGSYTFQWTNASDPYQVDGYSEAYRVCPEGQRGVGVQVAVSDGSATATTAVIATCPRT